MALPMSMVYYISVHDLFGQHCYTHMYLLTIIYWWGGTPNLSLYTILLTSFYVAHTECGLGKKGYQPMYFFSFNVTPDFNHLDLRNAMVPLTMPSASNFQFLICQRYGFPTEHLTKVFLDIFFFLCFLERRIGGTRCEFCAQRVG